ncbi:MAG TPA: hypothetical protein VI757_11915 [Bacteroidia bacterium]|nr:hypothetical protein [Bacteroidia bacterium]
MKKIYHAAIAVLFLFGCNGASSLPETKIEPGDSAFMSPADAEKILGEKAHVTERTPETKDKPVNYRCTYTADTADAKTGKTGAVYFMFEEYAEVLSAQKNYSSIKKANENHEGVKVLSDVGDEAYFHTDNENFYFILVRKGKKMFRIKVNKITSHTSLDEFNAFAKKLAERL